MTSDNNYSMYEYIRQRDSGENREVINFESHAVFSNDFYAEVDKLASYMSLQGVRVGDSIAICLPNIPSAVIAFYAANKIGAVANVIHPLVPPLGIEEILVRIPSRIVFIFDIFYTKYQEIFDKLHVKVVVCSAGDHLPIFKATALKIATFNKIRGIIYSDRVKSYNSVMRNDYPQIGDYHVADIGEKIAAYLHSGGTTGEPKTVMLSNRALNACAYNIGTLIGFKTEAGVSMLMVLPLFHVFGMGVCMHATLSAGARIVMIPSFKPEKTAKVIAKQGVNYISGVPSMYEKLLKTKRFEGNHLRYLKECYCGGDKLSQSLKNRFDDTVKRYGSTATLCEGYGLSEATICAVNVKEDSVVGSVGKALGRTGGMIADENGHALKSGELGEICLSGDTLMSGYYGDKVTTSEVMFTDGDGTLWVRTGDLGKMDEDGHIYFVERKKRMMKVSGINVFPSEIEEVVCKYLPQIQRCCAVESVVDNKTAVKLYVVLKEGKLDGTEEDKIRSCIAERLMKYSVPKIIVEKQSLPITSIGKVDYKQLEDKR